MEGGRGRIGKGGTGRYRGGKDGGRGGMGGGGEGRGGALDMGSAPPPQRQALDPPLAPMESSNGAGAQNTRMIPISDR